MFNYRVFISIIGFSFSSLVQAQDPMQSHRITALKGLHDVALVLRQNAGIEVLTLKEISDAYELSVKKKITDLQIKQDAANSKNWLELSFITDSDGALVEISLYRGVTIIATGDTVFAKVWDDKRVMFGSIKRNDLREAIDTLVISFATDYMRASQAQPIPR